MTVDTLEYVKKLESAGVERRVAEAHAQALRDVVVPELATKADLDNAVIRLESKINELRTEMWKPGLAIILATTTLTAFVQKLLSREASRSPGNSGFRG